MLKGNMLIAHGGGPTPVINSSLLGAVREAKRHGEIETIYGGGQAPRRDRDHLRRPVRRRGHPGRGPDGPGGV